MSNERPHITLTLPYGHILTLNEYITGHEFEEIVDIYRLGKEANEDAKQLAVKADKRLYEILAVTLDGSTEQVYERVRQLPKQAYDIAVKTILEHFEGKNVPGTPLQPTPQAAS